MFGSLRIARHRFSLGQRETYRASFCGSCHAMREAGGHLSALLTNYDQTVLALVLGGLTAAPVSFRPCTALPLRRVPVSELPIEMRQFLADLNTALVAAKLIDDVQDDDARLLKRGVLHVFAGRTARAHERLRGSGFPVDEILGLPARQAAAESRPADLAGVASPTAELTATLFGFAGRLAGRPDRIPALRAFGSALGRYVYVLDALFDRDDDRRRGRFNAVRVCLGDDPASALLDLRRQVARMRAALAQLPLGERAVILHHLVDSLEHRLEHHVGGRSAEAGDCECACAACEGCDGACTCCDGAECCCWWRERNGRQRNR